MTPDAPVAAPTEDVVGAATARAEWIVVAAADGASAARPRMLSTRRVVWGLVGGLALVLVAVSLLGIWAGRLLAEREAVNGAAGFADLFAEAIVQPALGEGIAEGDDEEIAAFGRSAREGMLSDAVLGIRLQTPEGTILFDADPSLIGQTRPLDTPRAAALSDPQTRAQVIDAEEGERIVDVYRPVWTSSGRELLLELHLPSSSVAGRSADLSRGFAGVTLSSLLLLAALAAPLVWQLVCRVRDAEAQRAMLLQRAIDASDAERRRIAGSLHDGPVQELIATSLALEGSAAQAASEGDGDGAARLRRVAGQVRGGVRALRSLLVDIYPATLARAGLGQALADLADTVTTHRTRVELDLAPVALTERQQKLVYRVAQECLRNAAAHAGHCTVTVRLSAEPRGVQLEVADDGIGFDPALLNSPAEGHLGLRVLADLGEEAGAELSLRTAPGAGTAWRLVIPDGLT
ncbi:sensor histidine kinase [Microbacterium fluvii]|uniref:Sensor histidine kinase n=1 Tax=Microbacterium fluvii TaxID=415215 RepID=A0ABW2HEG9_9MICO|nr:ATP-binding protein [Microbacterium fluvii]MCU4672485.1 histidine kinase [Microbacterium fluvii]